MSNELNEIDAAIDSFYKSSEKDWKATLEQGKQNLKQKALNEVERVRICSKNGDYFGVAFHIMTASSIRDYLRTLK